MKKIEKCRKFAIFAVIPFHIPMLIAFLSHNTERWEYILTVLIAFFGDIFLSFWQMEITTSVYAKIGDFAKAFLPYFLEKCVIVGAEFLLCILNDDHDILNGDGWDWAIWWLFAAGIAALVALVTFVTGAARTMLYHDEK